MRPAVVQSTEHDVIPVTVEAEWHMSQTNRRWSPSCKELKMRGGDTCGKNYLTSSIFLSAPIHNKAQMLKQHCIKKSTEVQKAVDKSYGLFSSKVFSQSIKLIVQPYSKSNDRSTN